MAYDMEKPLSRVTRREKGVAPALMRVQFRTVICLRFCRQDCRRPVVTTCNRGAFIVVRNPEQKKKLRAASFNQAKVEEASVMIVACGDADGWRSGDLEEMLRLGRLGGMPEKLRRKRRSPRFPTIFPTTPTCLCGSTGRSCWLLPTCCSWLRVMGYDTAPMEGFEEDKVREVLKLPLSYSVVALLGIGHLKGPDKFRSDRFSMGRTVFAEEYGKPIQFSEE